MEPKVDLGHRTGRDYHTLYGFSDPSSISSRTNGPNLGSPTCYTRQEPYNSPSNASTTCSPTRCNDVSSVASSAAMLERMRISSLSAKEQKATKLKSGEGFVSSIFMRVEADERMDGSSDSDMDEDDEMEEEEEEKEGSEDDNNDDEEEEVEEDDETEEEVDEDDDISSASSETLPVTWDLSQLKDRNDYDNDGSDDDSERTITTDYSSSIGAASVEATPMTTPTSSLSEDPDMQMNTQVDFEQGQNYYDNYRNDDENYDSDYTEIGSSEPRRLSHGHTGVQSPLQGELQQRHLYPSPTLSEGDCLRKAKSISKGQEYRRNQGDCFVSLEKALMQLDEWIRPHTPLSKQNAGVSGLTYQKRDLLIGATEFVWRYGAMQKRFDRMASTVSGVDQLMRLLDSIEIISMRRGRKARLFMERGLRRMMMQMGRKWGPKL